MNEKLYWKMLAGGGLAAAAITLIGCEPALAKTAGELGAHIASQGDNLGKAVSAMSYVIGMG
ncbi:MAG: hypothetical protein KDJ31_19790, partial [Candidatus Competibacteraceae bacterium]|nr:hypothetical protein [Candidatus Competibacteraceae bacterium]